MRTYRLFAAVALALGLAMGGCRAEVEDPGEAPEVNVDPGKAPQVDVDPVDVDASVGTDTQKVVVPDVDISTEPAGKDN